MPMDKPAASPRAPFGRTPGARAWARGAAVAALGLAAGGAVAMAGAGLGLAAMAGLAFFVLSLRTIEPALLASVAIMMVFGRDELYRFDIRFAGGGLKPSDLLLGVVLAAWLARVLVLGRTVLRLPRLFSALVLFFLLLATVSALGSLTSGVYFKDALLELRPLLQYLLVFPLMAEFDAARLGRSVWILLAVSVFSSARILANYWMGVGEVLLYGEGIRVVLLELGAYLPPVILGFVLAMHHVRPRLSLGIGLLNLAALAVTFFRSAYLGLSSGLFFVFLLEEAKVRRAMLKTFLGLLLGVSVLGVAYSVVRPRAANPLESIVTRVLSLREFREDISSLHRLREWEAGMEMIRQSPVWGNGLGTRVVFESPMYDPDEKQLGYLSRDIYMHNSYMWLLVKMGAVGLSSFLALWACAAWTAVRSARRLADEAQRALLLSMAGVLAGNAVISVFGPMFTIDNMTPINAFILGSVFILAREARNPWENEA